MKHNNFKFFICFILTLLLACFVFTAYATPAPVTSFDVAAEQEQPAMLSAEPASANTPVTRTYTSADSIRVDDPTGIKFFAEISLNHTADEIGWIVTTNNKLEEAGIGVDDFTKDSPVEMVTGINYSKSQGIKKSMKTENGAYVFSAVLTEINADNYHTRIIARPYAVDKNGTLYGETYMGAIFLAAELAKEELYTEMTNEQRAVVNSILDEREVLYSEHRVVSECEIGEDGTGKWRAYYSLYDVVSGEKHTEIPSANSYEKIADVPLNYNPGDVVTVIFADDGLYVSEEGKVQGADLTENSLVWLGNYNETDKTFVAVPYTTDLGSCEACITEYMNKAQGKNIDFMTGAEIGNKIKITNLTAISVIKYSAFDENLWRYGAINTPWPDDALITDKNDIKCYNDMAENESGFYTGYSKYMKAYVSAENGKAKVIVVVVNGNEQTAMNELCQLHK